ncbi:protein of unknown function [Streptomyces murinus]
MDAFWDGSAGCRESFRGEDSWHRPDLRHVWEQARELPQLGAPRASLVRPDHRRVIFSDRLKSPRHQEYARPHLHAELPFEHVRSGRTGIRKPAHPEG